MTLSFVDSHAHLSMKEFNEDRNHVIQRAFQEGISTILCPAEITDPKNLQITLDLTEKYENILAAAGVHPHQAKAYNLNCAEKMEELAEAKKIKAIGEIGLDFHYNFSPQQDQTEAFRYQLNVAQKMSLPIIVHSRKAGEEIARAVEEEHFTQGGILHCFTGDLEFAKRMMNQNFFISFSGILTFPKAFLLRDVAKKIPLEKLLIETDSPYLVPASFRGRIKRNEPIYVKEVAKILAELKNIALEELALITSKNFEYLFMV